MNPSKTKTKKSILLNKLMVRLMIFLFVFALTSSVIMAEKKGQKGYLGVSVTKLSRLDRRQLDVEFGILVTEVEKNSPADKAGLLEDDVIQYLKGEKIRETMDLVEVVRGTSPGEKVKLKLVRNGKNKTLNVAMGEYKTSLYSKLVPKSTFKKEDFQKWIPKKGDKKLEHFFTPRARGYMGVNLHALDENLGAYFGVKKDGGPLILSVEEKSPAEKSGLKAGDVILAINKKPMLKTGDVVKAVSEHKPGEEITVNILRHKKEKLIKVKLGKAKGVFGYQIMKGVPGSLKHFDLHVPHGGMLKGHFDKGKNIYLWNFNSKLKDKLKNLRNLKMHVKPNVKVKIEDIKKKYKDKLKKARKIKIHPFYI